MHAVPPLRYLWVALPPAVAAVLFLGPWAPGGSTGATTPAVLCGALAGALLGALAIQLLGAWHHRRAAATTAPLRHVQSLRLSSRHRVHVLQNEAGTLLLGECRGSLTLLEFTPRSLVDDVDDGAVPPDLLIPRRAARLPTRPRRASSPPPDAATAASGKLAEFRQLLDQARAGAPR